MATDHYLNEGWADREVLRTYMRHFAELCLTANGYAIIVTLGINLNGVNRMSKPQLFVADDGTVQAVVESETLTLDGLDTQIAEVQSRLTELQELRADVAALSNPTAPADPVTGPVDPPSAFPVQPGSGPGVVSADGSVTDQGAVAPVDPAAGAPANTSAFNNGQADPAAASNPTPPVVTAPVSTDDGGATDTTEQPIVSV